MNYMSMSCYRRLCKINNLDNTLNPFSFSSTHCACTASGHCTDNLRYVIITIAFISEITQSPVTHEIKVFILDECPVDLIIGRPTVKQLSLCSIMPSHCFASADARKIIEAAKSVEKGLVCTICSECELPHRKKKENSPLYDNISLISSKTIFSTMDYPTEENGLCDDYPFEEPVNSEGIPSPAVPNGP